MVTLCTTKFLSFFLSFFLILKSFYLIIVSVKSYCCTKSHSDTPHSVGLLWTSDQPDAQTAT
jgi:hypothetical protein